MSFARRTQTDAARCAGALISLFAAASVVPAAPPPNGDEGANVQAALESAAVLLRLGQPAEALAALEPVERAEPDNPWLWFYCGSARAQLGEPYEALAALDRAADILIGLGGPDPDLAEAVARERARARRQVFNVSVRTGLAYDTNVTFLGGGASSLGLIAGRADGQFGSSLRLDFAPVSDAETTFALGVRFDHAWQFAIEQFNWQDYGGYLRAARRLGGGLETSFEYAYDISVLGNESFLSRHVLTPALTYHWSGGTERFRLDETSVFYRFEARDFLFDASPVVDQDGLLHGVGVQQRLHVRPLAASPWVWDVGLGYVFQSVFTQGREFDRRTHDFFVSVEMPLLNPLDPDKYLLIPDKELRFRGDVLWQLAGHRHGSIYDRDHDQRQDLLTTFGMTISQRLIEDPRAGDLTLHAVVQWTDADSNVRTREGITPFTYERAVYGLQIEWSW